MTPGEHYTEAERLLDHAKEDVRTADEHDDFTRAKVLDRASIAIACANVHAQLAQAGAVTDRLSSLETLANEARYPWMADS